MKKTSERIIILRVMAVYAVAMLGLLLTALLLRIPSKESTTEKVIQTVVEKEYVYLTQEDTDTQYNEDTDTSTSQDETYTVREYFGRIGIFKSDGALMRVLEVYVKTLPEADKRLLGEGFEIVGKKQLNSIIEDYTE